MEREGASRRRRRLINYVRFEPVDEEVVIAVAQAEDLAQQVRVDRVGRRAGEQRALEQDEQGANVVFRIQPAK